jgi:hypothetical protein
MPYTTHLSPAASLSYRYHWNLDHGNCLGAAAGGGGGGGLEKKPSNGLQAASGPMDAGCYKQQSIAASQSASVFVPSVRFWLWPILNPNRGVMGFFVFAHFVIALSNSILTFG